MQLRRVATRPTWLLGRANARAQAILAAGFASAGLRGYHYRLLAALDEEGQHSQADLGRSAGIDRKDVAVALAELEGLGLVAREPSSADRRRNVVSLTEAGKQALLRLDDVLEQVQQEVLAPLGAEERRTFIDLLARLGPVEER